MKDEDQGKPFGTILVRHRVLVNTDPQRRCYDGCHFSSELQWTAWGSMEDVPVERAEERLLFWRGLSDYAVKESRDPARASEYKFFVPSTNRSTP